MPLLRHPLVLCSLGAIALWPAVARPCSVIGSPEPPSLSGLEFTAMPLLIGPAPSPGRPVLEEVDGSTLALDLDAAGNAAFAALQYRRSPRALYTTPVPLGPGAYRLGDDAFTIVARHGEATIDVTAVPPVDGAEVRLSIYEGNVCGATGFELTLPAASTTHPRIYALEMESASGLRSAALFSATYPNVFVWPDGDVAIDVTSERVCLTLKGLAWDGTQSEADLGCIDPGDADDVRVTRSGGGCSTMGGTPAGLAPMLALVGAMALLRRRRAA